MENPGDHREFDESIVFKILTGEQWRLFQESGTFSGSPDDERDGFIHLSARHQVHGTMQKHYSGQTGLVILAVRTGDLESELRWETSRGGQLFPHLYGTLNMAAIAEAFPGDLSSGFPA